MRRCGGIEQRLAAAAAVAGALLTFGLTPLSGAPAARADFDDLLADLLDPADWGAVFDPGFDPAPAAAAVPFDAPGDVGTVPASVPGAIPLHVEGTGTGQPVVDVSIGGGPSIPLALDTGSKGIEVSMWRMGPEFIFDALRHFKFSEIDITRFAAGFNIGLDVPTTVDFGNGIVADHATVDAVLFSFPLSVIHAQSLAGAPVDGILGIGPNAGGSNPVTTLLPGDLGDGVLIDEPGGQLVFGPEPGTVGGLNPIATLDGAPFVGSPQHPEDVQVQIGDGPKQDVAGVFDSGGKGGWLPSDVAGSSVVGALGFGQLATGTPVSVYTQDGDLLYSYTSSEGLGAMTILPDWFMKLLYGVSGFMNTGNAAFVDTPVYVSNADGGSMTFYGPPTSSP